MNEYDLQRVQNFYEYKIIVPYNRINKIFCNICRFTMKKVYDWDLGLTIKVENNNKTINIVCSVHTTVHQLKIEICKKLNSMIFDTQIDIFGGNNSSSWRPMKSTSTLLQNGIQGKFATLKAIIRRQKINNQLDVRVQQDYDKRIKAKKEQKQGNKCGLSLVASCTNKDCINYQQDTDIHIGYGTIPFYSLISGLKCQVCPYRSQYLRPSMMCKQVKLSYCNYKFEGTKTDDQGIPTQMASSFYTLKQQKPMLKSIVGKDWDKNIVVVIKPL